ncbi:hypothetical protein DY000_02000649 [Brassica cretica]|uniref:Uncharacterized protein n=1 Tax=Brassica cretica TaxID=69181 RepID=A0ABQ7CBT1_BRACR|nr:hypothetical protein DY000_02000649 [Brassica cretica]
MMESKAGNNKSKSSLFYEAPLGYSIEDVRPFGGIKKFKSSVYSNKSVNEIMMESKAGNKKSKSSLFYEAPLGYSIEDVRPFGGIKKFKSSVYSNCAKRPS